MLRIDVNGFRVFAFKMILAVADLSRLSNLDTSSVLLLTDLLHLPQHLPGSTRRTCVLHSLGRGCLPLAAPSRNRTVPPAVLTALTTRTRTRNTPLRGRITSRSQ